MLELIKYFANSILDLLKALAAIGFILLAIRLLITGNIFTGFLLFFTCLSVSVFILNSISSDTWTQVKQMEKNREEQNLCKEPSPYGYICPCCGHPAGEKVFEEDHTYRCHNCRYIW